MKVKYRKQRNILSCYNNDFELNLKVDMREINGENTVLYNPVDIVKFVDDSFIPKGTPVTIQDYEKYLKMFVYQGCSHTINNKVYLNLVGLKHFFSSFLSLRISESFPSEVINWSHSKFINWVLKFNIDSVVLKALNISDFSGACEFCKTIGSDIAVDKSSFCCNNPELIGNWRNNARKSGEPLEETDAKIDFLICLARVAGRELTRIIVHDNKISQKRSQTTPLANYDPHEDWESSSPIVKIFFEAILNETQSDLYKVTLRNSIFLGNQKRNYNLKPQSCYFTSAIIKYLSDKQKILDFLSSIGIGVGDDPINKLEKNQIDNFNSLFWTIPTNCTVMTVMDNNQADMATKGYNPLKDNHHVDGLNVLQVIKPVGNLNLDKESKHIGELVSTFVDTNTFEREAGEFFNQCFISMLLKLSDVQPTESLIDPAIQDIIPVGGDIPSRLVSDLVIKFIKEDGNVLKSRLLLGKKYEPCHICDPEDPKISWDNSLESKTSLRFLKIGKSTDDHVFLESLNFLYKTFKTDEREKIFITLDQALHFKFKNLVTRGKLPKEYIDFL